MTKKNWIVFASGIAIGIGLGFGTSLLIKGIKKDK